MRFRTLVSPGLAVGLASTVALTLLAGCASSTKILTSWKSPDFQEGSVKKVVVMGLTPNNSIRRQYESMFVEELRKLKIEAVPGLDVISELKGVEKEAALQQLQQAGVTHVLATRLVDRKTVQEYHPPTTVSVGVGGYGGYYGGWYPYMSVGYSTVASPGYYSQKEVYNLETNLYDLAADKLVWTGLSETVAYDAPSEKIEGFIDAMTYELRSKKIL
jgi:hypothetical protein